MPFSTLTTLDGAASRLSGPIVGAGVLSTRRGQAAMVPGRSPWTGKRGIGLKGTVRPLGLSSSVGGLWTWGGSQFLRVRGSVDDTMSICEKAVEIGSSRVPATAEAMCVHTWMGFLTFFSSHLFFLRLKLADEITLFFKESTTEWISEMDRVGTYFLRKAQSRSPWNPAVLLSLFRPFRSFLCSARCHLQASFPGHCAAGSFFKLRCGLVRVRGGGFIASHVANTEQAKMATTRLELKIHVTNSG